MLTLLRFDLKNTWFKMFVYCAVVAVFTAVTIYFWSDAFGKFFNNENFYWITIFKYGSLGICGAVCLICLIMTFITLAQWFSQNLLAEEGHFMNMLPVSKLKLFSSKTITAVIWNFILIGFMLVCITVFLTFGSRMEQINDVIADLLGDGGDSLHLGHLIALFGLLMLMHSTLVSILAYTSICIGQMVNYCRNVLVLLGFVGIGLAEIVIGAVLAYILGVFNFSGLDSLVGMVSYFSGFCVKMSVVSFINCLITFGLGVHLLGSRLNID
jgi:uncharacterized membrane protein